MNNRILAIDVLRGLILFGVIIVNAVTINGPYYLDTIGFAFQLHWLDSITSQIISVLLLEKFYPIFVFLFGLSNQIFLSRLLTKYTEKYKNQENKNKLARAKILKIFTKRMFILAIIGFIHLSLFYWGDVLLVYSILGFILVFILNNVFKYNYKKLIKLNIILILTTISLNLFNYQLVSTNTYYNNFDHYYINSVKGIDDTLENHVAIYTDGKLNNNIGNNLESYYKVFIFGIFKNFDLMIALDNINYFIELFILMLFGSILALIPNWYEKIINTENKLLIKIASVCFSISLFYEMLSHLDVHLLDYFNVLLILNSILLYLSCYILLFKNTSGKYQWDIRLNKIASIGRMTLTWYLGLSALMSFLLHDYGFGLFGTMCVTACAFIGITYYIFSYNLSYKYLEKYKQGPIEKLWRNLSVPKDHDVTVRIANS